MKKLKTIALSIGALLPLGLSILLGFRLSEDALALLVGMVLGVMASIPSTLLVTFALLQRDRQAMPGPNKAYPGQQGPVQPPVVVVTGNAPHQAQSYPYMASGQTPNTQNADPNLHPMPIDRQFTVVGEELSDF